MPRVPVLTEHSGHAELVETDVGKSDASLAGRYWSAGYARFLETGDVEVLQQFEGETIGGIPVATDPDAIEEFDDTHGRFDFQEIYRP